MDDRNRRKLKTDCIGCVIVAAIVNKGHRKAHIVQSAFEKTSKTEKCRVAPVMRSHQDSQIHGHSRFVDLRLVLALTTFIKGNESVAHVSSARAW